MNMNTSTINTPVLNTYWRTIRIWNDTMKIALISKISASLLKQKKKQMRNLAHSLVFLKTMTSPLHKKFEK